MLADQLIPVEHLIAEPDLYTYTKSADSAQVVRWFRNIGPVPEGAHVLVLYDAKCSSTRHLRPYMGRDVNGSNTTFGIPAQAAQAVDNEWATYTFDITTTGECTRLWLTASSGSGSEGSVFELRNVTASIVEICGGGAIL